MGIGCIKNISDNKLIVSICKYIFVTTLLVVDLFFSCCQAAERNYDAVKVARIVWRASPIVDVWLSEKKPFRYDFSKLHADLKKNTADDRKQLGE